MAIDFPASPTVGQQYTYANITYTFTAEGIWSAGIVPAAVSQIGFRANRNAVDMTGIPSATNTKVPFQTEEYDYGNYYDTVNSRWTPPAGLIHIDIGYFISAGVSAGGTANCIIAKNGAIYRQGVIITSTTMAGTQVSADDIASGTDYYEAWINCGGTTTIQGTPLHTYFSGHRVGGPIGPTGPTGVITGPPGAGAGRLEFVDATHLKFAPYGGNQIRINSAWYTIPAAGIAGLTAPTVYIGGALGPLVANTTYHVAAFDNAGVVTASFFVSPGPGHQTCTLAGMEGIEVMGTGGGQNVAFVLIGMVRTNASAQFADTVANRSVLSWFNRRNRAFAGSNTAGVSFGSATPTEAAASNRGFFLTWAEEDVHIWLTGEAIGVAGGGNQLAGGYVFVDGANVLPQASQATTYTSGVVTLTGVTTMSMSEIYHYIVPGLYASPASAQFYLAAGGMIRG